jgi:hypothetical protein
MNADAKKRYKDIDFPFTCPITNREFNTPVGLSVYATKTLKINHHDYYLKYINHRDHTCFFCGGIGEFISISKGFRNLCNKKECVKKSFNSHSIEGFMYRNMCSREEADILFQEENKRQLEERTKTQNKLREEDPLWDKKRSRNCKEFWLEKGYTEEDAILKSKEVMKEIHQKTSKKLTSNPEKYASKYPTKVEYYLDKGYDLETAKNEISKIQNRFSLQGCIEKWGEELGREMWKKRQDKWMKSLTENGNLKGGYSKISQDLFNKIIDIYNKKDLEEVYFWQKNKEFYIKSDKKIYLYDFTDLKNKKIIEYNGDQYHANPLIYSPTSMPHPYHKSNNFTSEKIWENDKIKIETAKKEGFDVLIVWDSEYKKNPKQIIDKCIEFLNGKDNDK